MKKNKTSERTSDAIKILDHMIGDNAKTRHLVEEARASAAVGQLIYDARTKAGLSQAQLAALIGTTQSAIARLEDADYEGHSLTMLNRIAAALERRVEVRFVARPKLQAA